MDGSTLEMVTEVGRSVAWNPLITVLALLALMVVVFVLQNLVRQFNARQAEPCVILTVIHAEDRPTVLQLVARNIGNGLAEDIRFEFSRPIPAQAFGLTVEDARGGETMKTGPLVDGIAALGPGESRRLDWGQYGGLMAKLGHDPVLATCTFRSRGRKMRPVKCPLDIASFAGTIVVESSEAKIARELAVISANTGAIARELAGLRHTLDVAGQALDAEDTSA